MLVLLPTTADGKTMGPVLGGYDVVAYQTILSAGEFGVMGSKKYSYDLLSTDLSTGSTGKMLPTNYTFYFSSEGHRQIFSNNPWKYVPRFGGF